MADRNAGPAGKLSRPPKGEDHAVLATRFLSEAPLTTGLDAQSAAALIASAADITLILNSDGAVQDVSVRPSDLAQELGNLQGWLGKPIAALIAADSRPKAEALLEDVRKGVDSRPRHLNHLGPDGRSVPIAYRCCRYGDQDTLIAFGRDMRDVSLLQQRLVAVQQKFERDYRKWRDLDARYRLLFQLTSEPILIIDALRLRVTETNPAARALFGVEVGDLTGLALSNLLDDESLPAVEAHLSAARAGLRVDDIVATFLTRAQQSRTVSFGASFSRQESESHFLLRFAAPNAPPHDQREAQVKAKLLAVMEHAPDAVVLTEEGGRLISANAAFLDMVQAASDDMLRGRPLDEWVGNSAVDVTVLLATLRQRGVVRLFSSVVHGRDASATQVEISAVAIRSFGQPCYGFALRSVESRPAMDVQTPPRALTRSVEQLTELIGQVPLKDLVREATEVIERLCIEAALELTGDNRASAAEMLGLSRQSLYVKLRRYDLGDLDGAEEAE